MPLRWLVEPESWSVPDGTSLLVAAGPRTDWFVDPQRGPEPSLNAPALVGDPSDDYLLSARVTVDFAGTFDAGVLMLHANDRSWAKLCFEYSPEREPMVVSVVTRDVSDDCNSVVVDGNSIWLRIARVGTRVRVPRLGRRRPLELRPPLRAGRGRRAVGRVRRAVPEGTAVPSRSSRSPSTPAGSTTCAAARRGPSTATGLTLAAEPPTTGSCPLRRMPQIGPSTALRACGRLPSSTNCL